MIYTDNLTKIDKQLQKLCKERGMPEPQWQSGKKTGVTLTFYAPKNTKNQIGGQIGGQIDLPERQAEVLELIRKIPDISRKDLAQVMKINESAVQKHTDALNKEGIYKKTWKDTGSMGDCWIMSISNLAIFKWPVLLYYTSNSTLHTTQRCGPGRVFFFINRKGSSKEEPFLLPGLITSIHIWVGRIMACVYNIIQKRKVINLWNWIEFAI